MSSLRRLKLATLMDRAGYAQPTIFAGFPAAIAYAGTSQSTTTPAPIGQRI